MIRSLDVTRSALVAQRVRLDVIASNMAHAFDTAQADGTIEPYRRRIATLAKNSFDGQPGVRIKSITEDQAPPRLQYDPGHPHAIRAGPQAGYVRYPNVNLTMEYVDAMEASRAYEANVAMMGMTRDMILQTLQLMA
jgi:flagellar basal-body rod protein FlgC